ncbi:hypothetical protein CUMW_175770 [Citrus unshiu]|uniref:DNA mismatch repair protein S5 domain-containing protein n=1 Tax=Citrus unshiu TaxID=55188 RepID=A0A2H5PX52_CITUN|nr:hypothetical protein CUMW_175770 [Citrus unshiu]
MDTEEAWTPEAEAAAVKEPPKIHRLEESVVNRIAAGEVIQRPVSAVKELVENSLDANATSINVVVKDGGLKLIQVSDDGHGIRYEDLPILCERHTTSKLSKYEDLQSIKSMGFRGEALASMTYVGHVTVTTITKGHLHGYRVSYRDGVMENEPKACAAVKGTQIMVENLFYNMIARRKTLQNSSDDYTKIVDLLSRMAIHHTNVSFSCRKHGAARADVHSIATSSRLDSIRTVYGVSVASNLVQLEASEYNDSSSFVFKMDGYVSNSNYVAKKTTMVLFVNDRLVECAPLKRAVEIVYAATFPKASKPFIYMSIVLPPEHVDVNVHPTKREVQIFDSSDPAGRLHAYVQSKPHTSVASGPNLSAVRSSVRQRRNLNETADLTSIQELIDDVDRNCHSGLLDIVRHCSFIGMADDVYALLQHNTHMYLANVVSLSDPAPLSELLMLALKEEDLDVENSENDDLKEKIAEMNTELLKQKAEMLEEYFCVKIDTRGNLSRLPIILDQYTPDMDRIPEFVLCLGNDVDWEDEKCCFQAIAAALGNFYAMHPPLLPNPSGEGLQCYKKRKPLKNPVDIERYPNDAGDNVENEDEIEHQLLAEAEAAWAQREWSIQHVLFPAMRLFLKPLNSMATNGTFVKVASLEKLYKIFERC